MNTQRRYGFGRPLLRTLNVTVALAALYMFSAVPVLVFYRKQPSFPTSQEIVTMEAFYGPLFGTVQRLPGAEEKLLRLIIWLSGED